MTDEQLGLLMAGERPADLPTVDEPDAVAGDGASDEFGVDDDEPATPTDADAEEAGN